MKNNPMDRANLREALIEAGVAQLKEGGSELLSIRKVASRLGVSHAAPGYYFRTLADLRTAIAAKGFRMLAEAMLGEQRSAPDATREQILAMCRGYLDFASQEPALFHLLFGDADLDRDDPELIAAGAAAYAVLRETCARIESTSAALENETLVWSLIHGFASLSLSNTRRFPREVGPEVLFENLFARLGLCAEER